MRELRERKRGLRDEECHPPAPPGAGGSTVKHARPVTPHDHDSRSFRSLRPLGRMTLVFLMAIAPRLVAQDRGAAALSEMVEGLGTTGRVMMIGAHPDDEDTQLIAWLAKGRHVET